MRLLKHLNEKLELPKKKWVSVPLKTLDVDTRKRLWVMYEKTYKPIGLHIENVDKLINNYEVSWLIDTDKDSEPDAFIIYENTSHGQKIALLGTDGGILNKRLLVFKIIKLLKTAGWYVEASHKLADIFVAKKINIIKDADKIKSIIAPKAVEIINDEGLYKRKIGSLGMIEKRLFGLPK